MTDDEVKRSKLHSSINYNLHTSIDLLKLGVTLDQMVVEGLLHPAAARTFNIQASALLASIANANNQAFGMDPRPPII